MGDGKLRPGYLKSLSLLQFFSRDCTWSRSRLGRTRLPQMANTLEIKIPSFANGTKGRTVRPDFHNGQERPYPAGSPLYLLKTKMQNIKRVSFCTKLFKNTTFTTYE